MGIPEIVNEIIDYVPTIDWSVSYDNEVVSLFETTIRYLGGLLSGYDLLSGPLAHLADNKANVAALLDQAQNLANNLSYAFDTPTGIPSNNLYINNRSTDGSDTNGLATIGTLVLEWTHLSDLTGDDTYGELGQKGESYLLNPQPVSQTNSDLSQKMCTNFFKLSRHGLNPGLASSAPTLTSQLVSSRTQRADGTAETTASTNI
jgi:mannosyl-oligosaccharide alpha-1,2-mannosidase